ncbi:MAG: secretin N-terminal domain-containing protein [Opitutales bacterium]
MKRPFSSLYPFTVFFFLLPLVLTTGAAQENDATRDTAGTPEETVTNALGSVAESELKNPDELVGTLVLSDESADQVFALLEQWTGKIILRGGNLESVKINFNSRDPITKGEAVLALESLLTLNGIMLTDMGGNFMKAAPATEVNRHVPKMIEGSSLGKPPSQQVHAKLFKLEYLDAAKATGSLIQPLLSQSSATVVFEKANAILITDALINLQRIERMLEDADRPSAIRESIEFIELNYVQASDMQQRLDALIQGPLKAYLEGNTSITADERTNQLLVFTHPENMAVIKDVIENIDIDAAALTRSEVFPLKQAKAVDVVPIIETIITGQREGREKEADTSRGRERAPRNGNQEGAESGGDGEDAPAGADPEVPAEALSDLAESSRSLQFSGYVGLSPDERTNSIVAYGTESDLETLESLIEKIDIPLAQVRIEAIITEVTLSENQASGIQQLGFEFDADNNLNFGDSIPEDGDNGRFDGNEGGIFGSGFRVVGSTQGIFSAVLSTAESDNNVKVLSVPNIVVSHNEEGKINVSESRPIITGSTSSLEDRTTNVRSNVEFRDIGIQLTVTPLIGSDGTVQVEVEQIVDNVAGNITIDGNEQPIIGRREATSTVTVNSEEVIVLGGLQENRKNESNSYFPLVGRLPLIRKVFGGDSKDYTRSELVIFIRPTVMRRDSGVTSMTSGVIDVTPEGDAVRSFLETGSTGRLYLEGSKFEEKDEEKEQSPEDKE